MGALKLDSPPDITIIKCLLAADHGFVSGNDLAHTLGMSRVGVWSRLQRLREEGFRIAAVPGRGYRLEATPWNAHPDTIRALLALASIDAGLLFFPEIDSTNSEAERQLVTGRQTPFVIAATQQIRGRGRLGRSWHSPEEGNAYLTFAFQPELKPDQMQTFTLWMGLNLCNFIHQTTQLPVGVKWPNDIIIRDRKCGGILAEARIEDNRIIDLLIGVGLNINSDCNTWPASLKAKATSLSHHSGAPVALNPFLAGLICSGIGAYQRFLKSRIEEEFQALWGRFDTLAGRWIQAKPDQTTLEGKVEGIDRSGSLLVRDRRGRRIALRAGEVTLTDTYRENCV